MNAIFFTETKLILKTARHHAWMSRVIKHTMNKGRPITHLEMNNLIGDSQHGFRTNVAA